MNVLFIILIIAASYGNAKQFKEWTHCKDHKKCQKECTKQLDTPSQTCKKTGKTESCASTLGGKLYRCKCECISDCNFNQIVNSKLSVCGEGGQGINKMQSVDEEIADQIVYNIASVVYGNMPVVGTLFDVGFAAWDPMSPITSSFSLSNHIRDEINTVVGQLQQCMDDKISIDQVNNCEKIRNALVDEYETTTGSVGIQQIKDVEDTWDLFTVQLNIMFGEGSQGFSYLEYSGMLPVYQSLYPLYMIVATERLTYLKYILKDEANFYNQFKRAMRCLDTLENWIYSAQEHAVANLKTKVEKAKCRNEHTMYSLVSEWEEDFTETYIKNFLIDRAELMKLQPKLCQIKFKQSGNYLVDYALADNPDKYDRASAGMVTPEEVSNYNSYWYQIEEPDDEMQLQNNATNHYLTYWVDSVDGMIETSEIDSDSRYNYWKFESGNVDSLLSIGRQMKGAEEYIYETELHEAKFGRNNYAEQDLEFICIDIMNMNY